MGRLINTTPMESDGFAAPHRSGVQSTSLASGVVPSTSPGVVPSTSPGVVPSTSPGVVPSTSPGVVPSTSPGVVPSTSPEVVPSTSPGVVPSTSPGFVLSTSLGVIPSTNTSESVLSSVADHGPPFNFSLEQSFDSSYDESFNHGQFNTPNHPAATSEVPIPPVVSTEEVTSDADNGGLLRADLVRKLRKNSCSRRNFSAKLVEVLFDKETRRRSNVAGKLGKMKLNPILMEYIKSLSFQHFPIEEDESVESEWSRCVIAIDKKNRRLNKAGKNC